jgi:hypothetical protein
VGKEDVVVLGEKARRGRGFRGRERRVGEVEEFATPLVAKRAQLWPQPCDDLA